MSEQNPFNISNLVDIDTEKSLLRALMEFDTDETVMALVKLKRDHFFDEGHQEIFDVLRELDGRNLKLQMEIVRAELGGRDASLMQSLMDVAMVEPIASVSYAVGALEEKDRKRQLHLAAFELLNGIHGGESSHACANTASKRIDDATLSTAEDFKTYAEHKKEFRDMPPLAKISTGIPFLDSRLKGGLEAGKFMLLFGDPEAGKTSLGTQVLRNMSNSFKVMFFPFEFSTRSFIQQNKINEGKFNEDNFMIDDESTDIVDLVVKLKIFAKQGGQVALIDSQMMVTNIKNKGTSEEKETEKFTELAKVTIKYDLRIIFICQQGKEDTRSGTVTPMKSKNGAHAAHIIAYVEKPKPIYDEFGEISNKGERELVVYKNKQTGIFGRKPIKMDPETLEFSGRQYDEDDPRSKKTVGSGRPPKAAKEVMYEMEDKDGNVTPFESEHYPSEEPQEVASMQGSFDLPQI